MKKLILFTILILSTQLTQAQWAQVGSDIDGEAAHDYSGGDLSLSDDGNIIAIGSVFNDGVNGENSGHIRVFEIQGSSWIQLGNDIDGAAEYDYLSSVSLSADGTIIATGASNNDSSGNNSGQVRVLKYQGGSWVQIGADLNGKNDWDSFGWTVRLSADGLTMAVNGVNNDTGATNAGYVKIFNNQGGNWVQVGDEIVGEAEGDYFGYTLGKAISLNIDGSIVAIGSTRNDGNGTDAGHVRVYKNVSNNWVQIGDDIDGEAAGDTSGYSVSLNGEGNILAISAPYNEGNGYRSGHVRIYKNISNNWVQIGNDIDGEAIEDMSGVSVSLNNNGNVLAIGAIGNDGNGVDSGHTRVYVFQDNNWIQIGDDIDGEATDDLSGFCVSLNNDGSTVAIGAYKNDGSGEDAGHVRVYNTDFLSNSEYEYTAISIYPNPTKGILNLDLDLKISTISIYDATGRIVYEKNNPPQKDIDISYLPLGMYFVKINAENKLFTTLLIKE